MSKAEHAGESRFDELPSGSAGISIFVGRAFNYLEPKVT